MEQTVYLGRSTADQHVYARVAIERRSRDEVEYTDHTYGPAPICVSVTFSLIRLNAPKVPLSQIADGYWEGGGQVDEMARRIITDNANVRIVERAWREYHLNHLNAACDHMTPEMLARGDDESTGAWSHRMLDTVVCPETGYKWGQKWLAKRVPDEFIAELTAAVAALPEVRP